MKRKGTRMLPGRIATWMEKGGASLSDVRMVDVKIEATPTEEENGKSFLLYLLVFHRTGEGGQ